MKWVDRLRARREKGDEIVPAKPTAQAIAQATHEEVINLAENVLEQSDNLVGRADKAVDRMAQSIRELSSMMEKDGDRFHFGRR